MNVIKRRSAFNLQRFIFPVLIGFLFVYTFNQFFSGNRNIFKWNSLSNSTHELTRENAQLQKELELMQAKVNRLQPASLDKDYVEELIRRNLPILKANEKIIYLPK